ncbi:hypothetical protein FIV41_33935 [Pseudomonas marginalis]|uniref:Lipoprotein n=1 Tax=Pseudomonas marginalis TaxID=298 RepID=A0A9X9BJN5_PSEMA|nr:hypothetical protein [Pseudomonas marginalis]TWR44426.1 hypothetical protein FIV41_33935 [Pseudomonas marginalis]SEB32868.1 hypothetical protein SAMN04490193_0190 [Pseudomonas marginalis]
MKPQFFIPVLGAVLLLSACASPIPKADPSEAWIGLKEEAPNSLMAERVDGRRIDDGRFFEVPPGNHRLDVTLFEQEPGDDNNQECQAHIDYKHFNAGEHYTLLESSLGTALRATLQDGHGKEVAATQDFDCMPG